MWSGNILLGFRAPLAVLSALALSGCVIGPANSQWFSESMLEELRTQQAYADFIPA